MFEKHWVRLKHSWIKYRQGGTFKTACLFVFEGIIIKSPSINPQFRNCCAFISHTSVWSCFWFLNGFELKAIAGIFCVWISGKSGVWFSCSTSLLCLIRLFWFHYFYVNPQMQKQAVCLKAGCANDCKWAFLIFLGTTQQGGNSWHDEPDAICIKSINTYDSKDQLACPLRL